MGRMEYIFVLSDQNSPNFVKIELGKFHTQND